MKTSVRLASAILQLRASELKLFLMSWCKVLKMFHKPSGILPKADTSLFKVKVSHHRWISTLHHLLITLAEVLCLALKGLTLYTHPRSLPAPCHLSS